MEVGKVYRFSSNSFAFLTMKMIFKKFEILTASRLGMSQKFHAKTRVISCSSKKYWFFEWGTTRILSFGSSIWCEFLKRQSFFVFSQKFFITRNKAKFSISEKKIEIEQQITKLLPHYPEREIELWYKEGDKFRLENLTITFLFDVRFQFSLQILKIQPYFSL